MCSSPAAARPRTTRRCGWSQYYQSRRGKNARSAISSRGIDAYHGSTYLTGSISGKPGDRSPYLHFIDDWVHHVSSPNVYRRPEGHERVAEFCDHSW